MSTKNPVFSRGDWVVHAVYGVGQIQGQVRKIIEEEEIEYYWIKTNNSDYWLPVEKANVDYVRPLATLEQISQALALMKKKPKTLSKDYYLRRKEIIGAIQNVSLEMKACMIRDLNGRKQDKGLNITEGDVLLLLKKNFLVEWAIVSGEENYLLESKLSEALKISPQKYSHA